MSRHNIEDDCYTVTVGWDSPMNTFFGTIFERRAKDGTDYEEPTVWLGSEVEEFQDIDRFVEVFESEAREQGLLGIGISNELAQTLERDRQREGEGFTERSDEIVEFVAKNQPNG